MNSNSLLSAFRLFRVKREERPLATVMLLVFLALDALVICKYYDVFTPQTTYYWHLFISKFHISGFDPITYSVVSNWTAGYNVYRHPLLAFFMYVPYLINQGLIWLTGINCAIFIVSAIQLFAAFYSMIFLYRICREVVGVSRTDSTLATVFYFGFAFVMLSTMVPDHFVISMMLLLLALYVSGKLILKKQRLSGWQATLYFFITAGTFGAMAFYGYTTKKDLTSLGKILFMALIGLIIATVVNMFLKSSGFEYILSYAGVAIFVGLTAWDSQKIKMMLQTQYDMSEGAQKLALIGALTLYLDFINLFLYLLRIFGSNKE